jgi:alpha-L-arabinofuranosidase
MPQGTLRIHSKKRGAPLGDLFGIFFEDLNHAADGGLYAELVQNRSFEFDPIDRPDYHALMAWEKVEKDGGKAELSVEDESPLNGRNLHYASIQIVNEGGGVGIRNLGFNTGIPVRQGESYLFSMYARRNDSFEEPVRVAIESAEGIVYAEVSITVGTAEWARYEAVLTANATDFSSRLAVTTKGKGQLCLDMVSLFPEKTYKRRPNGLREDIAALLAELKPKFMRFPGGCLVHDGSLNPDDRNSMYRWKNTIGDVAERPARRNNWSYNQTLGLGYYEYFQFCEDIGAKAIPVLPGGYDPHHKRIVPLDELGPWIDDALDLIEFATGDATTVWGAKRAELGHPEPFGLEYIAIGNEEVGEPFFERYPYFHKAIKERYPDIKIINSSGPFAAGGEYERGWKSARENRSELVDEHFYQSPEWFLAHYHRYDGFKADEPKVFLGEYATWGNTYYNALAEAAFMTGLEKNAHAVGLACYAPMLCNADYVNWKPDLIWFNNHQVYGTPNYYVQKLFMNHQGDYLLDIGAEGFGKPKEAPAAPVTGEIVLSAIRVSFQAREIRIVNDLTGEVRKVDGTVELSHEVQGAEAANAKSSLGLGTVDWERYTLSLKAVKTGGPRGFMIYFGKSDDKNQLSWEVGGWQNQDAAVCAAVNGRNSCLTQSLFTVETGVEYHLELKVDGRQIRTYIDGTLLNETEDLLPVLEPLYYTASVEDSTGNVIVKVVNVQEKSVSTALILEDYARESAAVEVYELAGYALEEENSFDSPAGVSTRERTVTMEGSTLSYDFSGHSVTVLRFK